MHFEGRDQVDSISSIVLIRHSNEIPFGAVIEKNQKVLI